MSTEQLKLPRLARDHETRDFRLATRKDGEPQRLSFSLSSEQPVERFFGQEILAHTPNAIRLNRFSGGAGPLLWNHNWDDPIGMIDRAQLDGGRLHVDAHLFDTARAKEVGAMLAGGLRNVSVGYEIHEVEVDDTLNLYRAIDWEPLEASIVTVPADATVGIGRAEDQEPKPVRVIRASSPASAANRSHPMTDETTAAAEKTADTNTSQPQTRSEPRIEHVADHHAPNALEIEKARKTAIQKLCRANHIDARVEEHWVKNGARLEQVSDELVNILDERSRQSDLPAMIGMEKKEVRRYSMLRALRASQNKDWSKAGLELEAHKAIMARDARNPRSDSSFYVPLDVQLRPNSGQRDLTGTTFAAIGDAGGSTGGQIVPDTYLAGSFIELLRNQSVVMGLGATRLSNLTGNITIPRQTGSSTAYWLADENAQITQSQPAFGQLTLTPKNVAAVTEISHQLIVQSDPSVEQLIMSDLARVLALAADIAALRGTGADGQPTGITETSGIGDFAPAAAAAMDYAGLIDAQKDLFAANALAPGCAYVADSGAASKLMGRTRFADTDTPLWNGSLFNATMAGFTARASNQMAANSMLFGLWSSLIIAEWGVLEIMTNPFSDFTRGLSSIRAWYTMDVGLRYPSAFTYAAVV